MCNKDLALSVGGAMLHEGAEIHFWKHRLDNKSQWWTLNSDSTLSPELNLDLVIGWQGDGQTPILVSRDS